MLSFRYKGSHKDISVNKSMMMLYVIFTDKWVLFRIKVGAPYQETMNALERERAEIKGAKTIEVTSLLFSNLR